MLYSWSVEGESPSPPSKQFSDAINAQVVACECQSDETLDQGEIETEFEKASFGGVDIIKYRSWGVHKARRTSDHVRDDRTDDILLYVPMTSRYTVQQNGKSIDVQPGTATFVRLDKPFVGTFIGDTGRPVTGANVRLPMSLIRERLPRIDECIHDLLPLGRGAGSVMLSLLESTLAEAQHMDARSTSMVGNTILDAICAVGLSQLGLRDDEAGTSAPDSRSPTRQRVEEFVLANLGNPELRPSYIAHHCNMSLRCLHLAFEGTGWTISSWTKEQRLLRCHQELGDKNLLHRSVAETAYGWGFKDLSHFSRAYKARFGVPPSYARPNQTTSRQ